jgi:hypothetical protein
MAEKKAKEITLGELGPVAITVNGSREVSADGSVAENGAMTAIAAAQGAYKIGDKLKEGSLTTIVFSFDENKDPIRLPVGICEGVFIGYTEFYHQDAGIRITNEKLGLQGQRALTRLTDEECAQLAKVWDKVAPPAPQRKAAQGLLARTWQKLTGPSANRKKAPPLFWGAEGFKIGGARLHRGGDTSTIIAHRYDRFAVPAALRGPVQS